MMQPETDTTIHSYLKETFQKKGETDTKKNESTFHYPRTISSWKVKPNLSKDAKCS